MLLSRIDIPHGSKKVHVFTVGKRIKQGNVLGKITEIDISDNDSYYSRNSQVKIYVNGMLMVQIRTDDYIAYPLFEEQSSHEE